MLRQKSTGQTVRQQTSLCLGALLLVSGWALAADPSPSLNEKKLNMIKGNPGGIVLFESAKPRQTAASAPAAAQAGAVTGATAPAHSPASGAAAPTAADKSPLFSGLPPPSGRSLNQARLQGAAGPGIALPTARRASQATP